MRLTFDSAAADFTRDALAAQQFAGLFLGEPVRGPKTGGRTEARTILQNYQAEQYGKSRNFLDAPVSQFSPYLRHGMISMPEVRDHLRNRYQSQPQLIEEFLRQLAWRDFFEQALDWHGAAFQDNLEAAKHAVPRRDALPADVAAGQTGLPCMDGILDELFTDGYLHNHERLWFAAYLCHFRGIHWQRGAQLFRQYLYDGDYASNTASWQWVESTFANKPYFMNQENINHYSGGRWCASCRVACPFRASYETLQHRLFETNSAPLAANTGGTMVAPAPVPPSGARPPEPSPVDEHAETVVWVHDAAISAADPTLAAHPDAAVVFVFDADLLAREPWAFHRLAFVLDGLADLFQSIPNPVKQVRLGSVVAEVSAFAQELGAGRIALTDGPYPGVRETAAALRGEFSVQTTARPRLTEYAGEPVRFTRYWDKVAPQVLGYVPRKKSKFHR